jgi:hypothetical protein
LQPISRWHGWPRWNGRREDSQIVIARVIVILCVMPVHQRFEDQRRFARFWPGIHFGASRPRPGHALESAPILHFLEFRTNHSYPLLKILWHRSYLIIFNLNGVVSYRDRGAGRTVNTSVLS